MRSLNEVAALVAKAARGAGSPPGQAAQFGQAAVLHLCRQRDEADLLAAFAALPEGPIITLPLSLLDVLEQAEDDAACASYPDTPLALSYAEALPFAIKVEEGLLHIDLAAPGVGNRSRRCDISDAFVAQCTALAAKILVPESEASRLSGAGAGLTDND